MKLQTLTLAILTVILVGCGPKTEPVEIDYIVPEDVDVIQVCENIQSTRRDGDTHCESNQEGYRWMYDQRGGHPELPAVGEKVFRSQFDWKKPEGDLKFDRLPYEGGWWNKLGPE